MATHYDALIIGSGQAGPFLAARLVQAGMQVALSELAPTLLGQLVPLDNTPAALSS